MLNLEVPAERVLKPLWVQLLLFCCCGVVLFCFIQEEGTSLYYGVDGVCMGSLRSQHVIWW